MIISIVFSFAIFQITNHEVSTRLQRLESGIMAAGFTNPPPDSLRQNQADQASANIAIELLYANLFVLIAGGAGSYLLARRTLRPIEVAHIAQSRFTSDASHELRTPLAVMKAEIEVTLRDKLSTNEELREVLESNLEEVENLTQLSEMLLNLSRLEHDKLEKKEFDLVSLARDTIKRLSLPETRVLLSGQKKVIGVGNPSMVGELIMILLENALKYSPEDSLVTIVITPRQHFASFEITNTGPGIAAEKLSFIFDRFYRADSSRTGGEKKGYGLGLALAKRIVEVHGGELSVTSEVDHRTSFTFLIPTIKDLQAKIQK